MQNILHRIVGQKSISFWGHLNQMLNDDLKLQYLIIFVIDGKYIQTYIPAYIHSR